MRTKRIADRFTADVSDASPGSLITLDSTQSHHLLRVLRAEVGCPLTVFGGGREFSARLSIHEGDHAIVELLNETPPSPMPVLKITSALPWLKGGRTEFLVQKLTELGVAKAIIYMSENEVAHGDASKLARLKTVARESCKQCRRGIELDISFQPSLRHAVESCRLPSGQSLVLFEREQSVQFTSALESAGIRNNEKSQPPILIASGPEGGFSDKEIETVAGCAVTVSLGSRILRADTAPIAAVSAALAVCGEF